MNDISGETKPTAINKMRRKWHELPGVQKEIEGTAKAFDLGTKGITGAVNFLMKAGLKQADIMEAIVNISQESGIKIPPEKIEKLKTFIDKMAQPGKVTEFTNKQILKTAKEAEEMEKFDPYTRKTEKKAEKKETKDIKEMEEDEIKMLMAEIEHTAKKRGVKLSQKELRMRAKKAMEERWGK